MATSKRKGVGDTHGKATTRCNLQVDASAHQRLLLHSIMSKESPGAIVSRLIDEHLREYRVQRNPTARVMSEVSVDSSGQASESEAVAA